MEEQSGAAAAMAEKSGAAAGTEEEEKSGAAAGTEEESGVAALLELLARHTGQRRMHMQPTTPPYPPPTTSKGETWREGETQEKDDGT